MSSPSLQPTNIDGPSKPNSDVAVASQARPHHPDTPLETTEKPKRDWNAALKMQSERIQPVSDLFGSIVKVGGPLSCIPTAVGAALLISYLHATGAPLPPPDAYLALFLLLIASVCIIFLGVTGVLLLGPFIYKKVDATTSQVLFPNLYGTASTTSALAGFTKSYVLFFAPFLTFMIVSSISATLSIKSPEPNAYLNPDYLIFLAFAVSCSLIAIRVRKHNFVRRK